MTTIKLDNLTATDKMNIGFMMVISGENTCKRGITQGIKLLILRHQELPVHERLHKKMGVNKKDLQVKAILCEDRLPSVTANHILLDKLTEQDCANICFLQKLTGQKTAKKAILQGLDMLIDSYVVFHSTNRHVFNNCFVVNG